MAKTNIVDAQSLYDSAMQESQRLSALYEKANIFAKAKIMIQLFKASNNLLDAENALEIAIYEQNKQTIKDLK